MTASQSSDYDNPERYLVWASPWWTGPRPWCANGWQIHRVVLECVLPPGHPGGHPDRHEYPAHSPYWMWPDRSHWMYREMEIRDAKARGPQRTLEAFA